MSRGRKDRFEPVDTPEKLSPSVPEGLPWLAEAAHLFDEEGEIGIADSRRFVRLVSWIDEHTWLNLPWCGLYVGHCIRKALPAQRLPWLYVRARPWRNFGVGVDPQLGAILHFWLRWPGSPFGHVGFYWGEDEDSYYVLGGNQHRTILIERFPKHRLIGCRWPEGVPELGIRRKHSPHDAEPFEYSKSG